jgi:hypothetical protein
MAAPCSIPDCDRPAEKRIWCNAHYRRWLTHGDPNVGGALKVAAVTPRQYAPGQTCSIEGCDKPGRLKRGLCGMHYQRWVQHGDPMVVIPPARVYEPGQTCEQPGCDKPIEGRGLCGAHYRRLRKHGDPAAGGPVRVGKYPSGQTCKEPGCGRQARARGLCNSHWQRWKKYGDTFTGGPIRTRRWRVAPGQTCKEPGCDKGWPLTRGLCKTHYTRWRKSNPTLGICDRPDCDRPRHARGLCQTHYIHANVDSGVRNHRNRARQYGVQYEHVDKRKVFARDKWRCGICGDKVDKRLKWPHLFSVSLDHVIPMSRGGDHTYANTQCAHLICNMRKHNGGSGEQLALIG